MTSPTQLKYLEAIGIPVWVSRDLVIQDQDSSLADITNPSSEKVPVLSGDSSSARSILSGLEEQSLTTTTKSNTVTQPAVLPSRSDRPNTASDDADIQGSEIARTQDHTVYACGSTNAEWMIIGESPEMNSDRQNQPYAAEAGVLLCNMLRAVGINQPRDDAYIINILQPAFKKPQSLNESSSELNTLLREKIKQVNPKILLVVGQIAAQNLLQSKEPLARLRGKEHLLPDTQIPVIVTYYPSYLLSKPMDKRKAWDDLKLAMRRLASDK